MSNVTLPSYNSTPGSQQPYNTYTNSNLLVANIPQILTVPTDENGRLARWVTFSKTSATAVDFYTKPMLGNDALEMGYDDTFGEFSTNGTFTTDTAWTKGTGWTIAAGVATATGAISTTIFQPAGIALVPGNTYMVTFTTTRSAGSVAVSLGGGTAGTSRSSAATFIEAIVAGSDGTITFTGNGFSGTLDNVSVSGWTLGTGWTTASNTATAAGAISVAITNASALPLVSGQTYLVTFTATRSAGSVAVSLGGGTAGTSRSTAATFSEIITAGSTQVVSFAGSGFSGTLTNVSITKCIAVPGIVTTGVAGDLNQPGYFLNGNVKVISLVSAGAPIVTSSFYK